MARPGLYANIHAKRKRIEAGSGEKMRKVGSPGAPSKQDFVDSAKTAKKKKKTLVGQEIIMPHTKAHMSPRNKKLAAMYGDKNKITRGDVIAAATKNKKPKKQTLVG